MPAAWDSFLIGQKIVSVVSEGTLGPMYGKYPDNKQIEANFNDLRELYQKSFTEFATFLPSGSRVVLCIPAYKKTRDSYEMMPNLDFISDIGYNLVDIIVPKIAKNFKFLKLSNRSTAIYDRKDQIVAREIIIFEKI